MLFYIQKFYYNNVGMVMCFTFKSPFTVIQRHLMKVLFLQLLQLGRQCIFQLQFHYEWFLWVCLKEWGELVWKAFCESESSSLLFQQPNTWQCEYKWITDSTNSVQPAVLSLQTLPCVHQFSAGWVFLVWYRGKSLKYIQLCFVEGWSFSVLFLKMDFFFLLPLCFT